MDLSAIYEHGIAAIGIAAAAGIGVGFVWFMARLIGGRGIGPPLAIMAVFLVALGAEVAAVDVLEGREPLETLSLPVRTSPSRSEAVRETAEPPVIRESEPTTEPTPEPAQVPTEADKEAAWHEIVFKYTEMATQMGFEHTVNVAGDMLALIVWSDEVTAECTACLLDGTVPDGWQDTVDAINAVTSTYKQMVDDAGLTDKHVFFRISDGVDQGQSFLVSMDGTTMLAAFDYR